MYLNLLVRVSKQTSNLKKLKNISISGYLTAKLANFLLPVLIILKVKANTITILNFLISFFCIFFLFFFEGIYVYFSLFFYVLNKILDHCDGGLARFYKNKTFFGKFLDSISDALFASIFNLSLAIFFYFKTNNFFLMILGSFSSVLLCFDIFILDKYSSLIRWSNQENRNNHPSYIRKNYYPRFFYTLEDFIFIGILAFYFFFNNFNYCQYILLSIFLIHFLSFFSNMFRHIFASYRFLNYNKK
jgi:phosphatidylglycerophosphate synthase